MFSKRLKQLRLQKKKTQEDMASFLGITRQGYGRYENGKAEPDIKTINILSEYFDVTTDYLLGRVDETDSMISIAFEDGGEEPLSDEEREHLEETLKNFRETKKRWLKARGLTEDDL